MKKLMMIVSKMIVAGTLVSTSVMMPVNMANAQSVSNESLNNDIKRLRRDLRDLQQLILQKSGSNDAVNRIKSDVSSSVYEQMSGLENTTVDLASRLENIEGDSLQSKEKFEKLSTDLEFRLQQLSDQLKEISLQVEKAEKVQAVSNTVSDLQKRLLEQQSLIKKQADALNRQADFLQKLTVQVNKSVENSAKALSSAEAAQKTSADVAKELEVQATKAKEVKVEKPTIDTSADIKVDEVVEIKVPEETKKVAGQSEDLKTKYDTAEAHYKAAVDAMSVDNLANAEALFVEFIKQYPGNTSIDDAKYQYGRLLALRGQNADAGQLFTDIYENYPKSNRRSSSLIELAKLYNGAGKVKNACGILDVFNDQFQGEKDTRDGKYVARLYKEYGCKS